MLFKLICLVVKTVKRPKNKKKIGYFLSFLFKINYFVPKILSPASPKPETIYPCSFSGAFAKCAT